MAKLDLGKLADIAKTVASASKSSSSKSTSSSSTKTVKKASSSSSSGLDLTSLLKGALSADSVKTLAKQANKNDDSILDNAGTILKKLISTKNNGMKM